MRWLTFIHESRESFGYVTSDGRGIVDVGARGIYPDLKAMITADELSETARLLGDEADVALAEIE
ncbi:MAG: hypothetical protein V3T18_08750, partial [Pseudomonadales bacterium]